MNARDSTILRGTLIAIPCALVGLGTLWLIASAFFVSFAANDWVKVRADVLTADVVPTGRRGSMQAVGTYRYEYKGATYESKQLGVGNWGGDNLGDWHLRVGNHLKGALAEKRPIMVFVNPDDPAQAVVDPDVRWATIGFLSIFAVVFTAAAAGFAYSAYKASTDKNWKPPKKKRYVPD